MKSLLWAAAPLMLAAASLAACSDGAPNAPAKGEQNAAAPAGVTQVAPDARLIVAFGDSLYAGYGLDNGQGFAPALQRALAAKGIKAVVFPAGVSGDTTAGGRARLGFVLNGLPRKPDLVIVGLGGNDMLRGIGVDQTRANLDAILSELDRRGIKAMLTGMLAPPNMGRDYATAFNALYPALAREHGVTLYPFFLDGVFGNRALFQQDGIHPTAPGIDRIVSRIEPVVAGEVGAAGR